MTTTSSAVSESYKRSRPAAIKRGAALDTPVKKAARERAQSVVQKAAEVTSEKVVGNLATLKVNVSAALDNIGSQLSGEIATLHEVQEAIAAQKAKLKDLYEIAEEADSLQTLILAQDEQKATFAQEQAAQREAWDAEKTAKNTERQREQEAFDYNTKKRRQNEEDAFKAQLTASGAALAERENVVKASEQELVTLRAQVANADAAQKAEVGKQVGIATNSLKKEMEHAHTLATMKLENELSQVRAQVSAKDVQIAELNKRIGDLDTKYADAASKVQSIAEKAIEGASQQKVVVQTGGEQVGNGRK